MDSNQDTLARLNQGMTLLIGGLLLVAGGAGVYRYGPGAAKRGAAVGAYLRPKKPEPIEFNFEYKPLVDFEASQNALQHIRVEDIEFGNRAMADSVHRQAMQDLDRTNRIMNGRYP